MNSVSDALPARREANTRDAILRLAAIALGVMSTLSIAWQGFNMQLSEFLATVVVLYEDTFSTLASLLVDPVVTAITEELQKRLAVDLRLYPHWKHAFVLLWLMFASTVRGHISERSHRTYVRFSFAWGGLVALLGGIMAGVEPLSNPRLFVWILAATVFWRGTDFVLTEVFWPSGNMPYRWWLRRVLWPELSKTVALGLACLSLGYWSGLSSPGLVSALLFMTAWAMWSLKRGWPWRVAGWNELFDQPFTRVGLRILSVLGTSAFILWVDHLLS